MAMHRQEHWQECWQEAGDGFELEVPAGWEQGRAAFGGLNATLALSLAARTTTERSSPTQRPLRTMQALLLGPIAPGKLSGQCRVLREGRTTSFVEVRLSQEGVERATFSFVFVAGRQGSIAVEPAPIPEWLAAGGNPEAIRKTPFFEGLSPEFTRRLDFRFVGGELPFKAGERARITGHVRFREDEGFSNTERQLALLDAWPCPTLALLEKPAFASTVTWTAHLTGVESAPGFHAFAYDTQWAHQGFTTASGHMWDAVGQYVGYTEQTVVVFD